MTTYAYLRVGDRLPSVGVLQALLARWGAAVKVDGAFGPRTQGAVTQFQRDAGLRPTGQVEPETWRALAQGLSLPVVDAIDVFDPGMRWRLEELRGAGSAPLELGGMSNGLAAFSLMMEAVRGVFLLRLVGHGNTGIQAITLGKGYLEKINEAGEPILDRNGHPIRDEQVELDHVTTSLNVQNTAWLKTSSLMGAFSRYGSVEMHGCRVASLKWGRLFMTRMADILDVPVSASLDKQHSGLRFNGRTVTVCPGGASLAAWCAGLRPFPRETAAPLRWSVGG